MDEIAAPITREKVQALTVKWADNPDSVGEVEHDAFNDDLQSGGFAFQCDRGLLIYGFDGSSRWSRYSGDAASRRDEVEQYWHMSQQRNWAVAAVQEFRDDDAGYVAWLDANPDCYVLNIRRNYNASDARLHRADCRTLTAQISRGVVLAGPCVKVCAGYLNELEQWVADQVAQPVLWCGTCAPGRSAGQSVSLVPPVSPEPTGQAVAAPLSEGRSMFYGPVQGSGAVEAWADDYIRFEGRPGWQEQLRTEIRSHCRQLERSDGDVLHAAFFGPKHPRADVENLVLYYIDSFSGVGRDGIRVEYGGPVAPRASDGEYRFCYRYSIGRRSDDFVYWEQVRPLASFDWTDLEGKALAQIWLALTRRRLLREVNAAEQTLAPGSPFAAKVQLRPPYGGRTQVNADLMKAVFDGVICAFQAHTDKDRPEVVARLAKFLQIAPEEVERLLCDQKGAVIGPVPRLVYPRGAGVQWNPSDDRCFAGEVVPAEPEPGGTCWAIKGELVEISFGATDSQRAPR